MDVKYPPTEADGLSSENVPYRLSGGTLLMNAAERIRRIADGDLEGLASPDPPDQDACKWLATISVLDKEPASLAEIGLHFTHLMSKGKVLQALAFLKILAVEDPAGTRLRPLLEHVLRQESATRGASLQPEFLASEFLGTDRSPMAWTVLRGDPLRLRSAPNPEAPSRDDEWIVCRDAQARAADGSQGLALVWHRKTAVPGEDSQAERRRASRRKLPLRVHVKFLGGPAEAMLARPYEADVIDIALTGVGLSFPNPYGWLRAEDMSARRVRLEIPLPSGSRTLVSLADVAWCRADQVHGERVLRFGLQFREPTPEFLQSIGELIKREKGDQHYLWSLWRAHEKGH